MLELLRAELKACIEDWEFINAQLTQHKDQHGCYVPPPLKMERAFCR
jgi:hypothetical protein